MNSSENIEYEILDDLPLRERIELGFDTLDQSCDESNENELIEFC